MSLIHGRYRSRLAFIAMFLLAFHTWASASALGSLTIASSGSHSTIIVCTASGPRVITLDTTVEVDKADLARPHANMLPHCCAPGCAMLGMPVLPGLYLLAWTLPPLPVPTYRAAAPVEALPVDLLSRSPGRPRGPPAA
ncbi:hypothetical protein [Bordetella sp. N]|uniref:hypothetical protein n=1 Tax=Bordetella sp. N TaxID=1746199 RepID=UPI00070D925A|nr:hypothetical protein [Bordetella sp. N]ALM82838.1 hypothetical protein ASB57_07625 [Bordetella sp. N]